MCIKSWMDCGIVSTGQLLVQMGILLITLSEQDFQNAKADFCCMKEFCLLLEAIKEN